MVSSSEASRSHLVDTPQSVGLLWASDRPEAETIYNSQKEANIHALGGIRTHNSSKEKMSDSRIKPARPLGPAK